MDFLSNINQQLILSQLMLGLVNGSFYALLAVGLSVIFGLLGVVNFAHGTLYMLGAYATWIGADRFGLSFWHALWLVPLLVGVVGVIFERTLLRQLYKLDPLYGLLLTFGVTLVVEGGLRAAYGVSGQTYRLPDAIRTSVDLGFMRLPMYRLMVVGFSAAVCLMVWLAVERTLLGSRLQAATESPRLTQALGVNVPAYLTIVFAFGSALAALAGVVAAPVIQVTPMMGTNVVIVVFAIVVIGGMGSILGSVLTGFGLGIVEGLTRAVYPEASATVIFLVMVVVLLFKPAGLFGRD